MEILLIILLGLRAICLVLQFFFLRNPGRRFKDMWFWLASAGFVVTTIAEICIRIFSL